MASTQSYENVAFSAPGNIRNAETDSNQSNIHKDEPNPYESLQHFNPEPPLKEPKTTTYRAACNRQYLCLGILIGVLGCIAFVAIGFAAAAWKNSMDAKGDVRVASLLQELEDKIERLTETQNNMQSYNDVMATRLINIENNHYTTESRLSNVENNTSEIEIMINAIKTSYQSAAESAFMAVMTVGTFLPEAGDVIPFSTAPVNPGSHYNTSSSVYTCPQHGLYIFSVSLNSDAIGGRFDETSVSGALMLDGVRVAEVYSDNNDPVYWQHQQSATTAVVDCPTGSTVWVQSRYSIKKIFGSVSYPRTIFTGYAIMLF